jgi:hypothetical protein
VLQIEGIRNFQDLIKENVYFMARIESVNIVSTEKGGIEEIGLHDL